MRTTFKIFLAEGSYGAAMLDEQAADFVKRNCSEALAMAKQGKFIFKGMRQPDDYYKIDPSKGIRRSANTSNYYNLIVSNAPNWTKYPVRQHSIICTNEEEYSTSFGDTFVVFPANHSVWGVCPEFDFWNSFYATMFHLEIDHLNMFNTALISFLDKIFADADIKYDFEPDSNLANLNKVFADAEECIRATGKNYDVEGDSFALFNEFLIERVLAGKSIFTVLCALLDPSMNEFKVTDISGATAKSKSAELWSESVCILVALDLVDEFIKLCE